MRDPMRNTYPRRGSHLPVLMKLVPITSGPVLELGCGVFSTCYLHWATFPHGRKLVTYENNPTYFPFIRQFEGPLHEVHCIDSWDTLDLSPSWSVAFVDHCPDPHRRIEIAKLTHAEYVVAHDAENSSDHKYRYSSIYGLFKYRYKYTTRGPATLILSNFHDLKDFTI